MSKLVAGLNSSPPYIDRGAKHLILQGLQRPEAKTLADQPWLRGLERLDRRERYKIYWLP